MTKKIGLALGSGAARGWAHIGIIEGLEKLGIKIDIVTGCSIGAYVGAAYSAGNLARLKSWICTLDEWQVASLMGVGIQKGGLVSGEKVFRKLQQELTTPLIEELEITFATLATDMRRGTEQWFTQGSTVDAIRASCSIPAIFPPHWYQDKWLIDGAVVNPVPVSLCRHLGADVVIAVNLSSDFSAANQEQQEQQQKANDDRFSQFMERSKEAFSQWWDAKFPPQESSKKITNKPDIPSLFTVMSNSLDIMQDRVTRSKLAGDPPDILLSPKLGHIGIMEFHRAEEIIKLGHRCVERMAEQIKYQLDIAD